MICNPRYLWEKCQGPTLFPVACTCKIYMSGNMCLSHTCIVVLQVHTDYFLYIMKYLFSLKLNSIICW